MGLLVTAAIFSNGLSGMTFPGYVQDVISLSPFFHHKEVIQLAARLSQTEHLSLYLWELGLYAFAAGYMANFVYKQDAVV